MLLKLGNKHTEIVKTDKIQLAQVPKCMVPSFFHVGYNLHFRLQKLAIWK